MAVQLGGGLALATDGSVTVFYPDADGRATSSVGSADPGIAASTIVIDGITINAQIGGSDGWVEVESFDGSESYRFLVKSTTTWAHWDIGIEMGSPGIRISGDDNAAGTLIARVHYRRVD